MKGRARAPGAKERPGCELIPVHFPFLFLLRAGVAFLTCWEGIPRAGGLLRVKIETLQALPQVSPRRRSRSTRHSRGTAPAYRPRWTRFPRQPCCWLTPPRLRPVESTCLPSCWPAPQTIALSWAATTRGPNGPRPGGGRASRRCEPTEGRPPPKSRHSPWPVASQNTVFLKPQECSVWKQSLPSWTST